MRGLSNKFIKFSEAYNDINDILTFKNEVKGMQLSKQYLDVNRT